MGTMNPHELVTGRGKSAVWADAFTDHGAYWEENGHNMLLLARDTQRWDVLDAVLQRDLPDAIAVLRLGLGKTQDEIALLKAYLRDDYAGYNGSRDTRALGLLFSLNAWREVFCDGADQFVDMANAWWDREMDELCSKEAFMPTAGNLPKWGFDRNAIDALCSLMESNLLMEHAVHAAVDLMDADEDLMPGHAQLAKSFMENLYGVRIEMAPPGACGAFLHELTDACWVVRLDDGGWTVVADDYGDAYVGGPFRSADPVADAFFTLERQGRQALGPFGFTPF
jgi:hypothetical protein